MQFSQILWFALWTMRRDSRLRVYMTQLMKLQHTTAHAYIV